MTEIPLTMERERPLTKVAQTRRGGLKARRLAERTPEAALRRAVHATGRPVVLQVIPELGAGGAEPIAMDLAAAVSRAGGLGLVASRGGFREDELAQAGGHLFRLPVHTKNPYGIAVNILRLRQLIDLAGVDVVHVHSRAPAWSALAAARLAGVPVLATYHGTYSGKSALKRFYNSGMVRGDALIACSQFIADYAARMHRLDPARLTVIPCGIDMAAFDPAAVSADRVTALRSAWGASGLAGPDDPRKKRILLLPARLTSWKGQRVFIEALARLKAGARHVDNWTAVLIGDAQGRTAYVDALKQRVRRLNLRDRVIFHGHCADMPAAYRAADLVICPSTDPESFGRVPVEAQAMERPVIATNHGGPRETIRDDGDPVRRTGWLVPPRDVKALAAALADGLDLDAEEWRAMGARGRDHVSDPYALSTMTGETLALYNDLIAARAARRHSARPAVPAAERF